MRVRARLEVEAKEGGHGLAGRWSGRRKAEAGAAVRRRSRRGVVGNLMVELRHTPLLAAAPVLPVRALPSPCSNNWRREAKKVHLRD